VAGPQTKQQNRNSNFGGSSYSLDTLYGSPIGEVEESILKERITAGKKYFLKNADSILPKTLVVVTALTFFVAVWQVSANFNISPIFPEGEPNSTQNLSAALQANLIADGSGDTDGDGVSDADELGIYGTSIYLADSDSDGISDYDEIQNGTDPNCLAGEDCENKLRQEANSVLSGGNLPANYTATGAAISADDLRNILADEGVPQADLDLLSDNDLAQIYNQAASATQSEIEFDDSFLNLDSSSTDVKSIISQMSASQLRQALLEAGLTETQLNQVSDEEIINLADEVLKTF